MQARSSRPPTLETRIIGAAVLVVLLLAFVALYIYPKNTATDFAWTIQPATTAILIGEGYLAGAYFFARVITEKNWHHVQAGFVPITVFTVAMLAATLLHWNRFHQGTFLFYLWTAIYLATPVLVPLLWWRNRARDPHTLERADLRFSSAARWGLGLVAVAGWLISVATFVWPGIFMLIAPWTLTPLTSRIFAGWSLLAFSTLLVVALDARWSATRILLQSVLIGQGLTLLALPRIWSDLDPAKPMTYIFIAGLVLAFVLFLFTYFRLERQSQRTG